MRCSVLLAHQSDAGTNKRGFRREEEEWFEVWAISCGGGWKELQPMKHWAALGGWVPPGSRSPARSLEWVVDPVDPVCDPTLPRLEMAALQAVLSESPVPVFPLSAGTHSGSTAVRTPKPKWGSRLLMGCPASTAASCS